MNLINPLTPCSVHKSKVQIHIYTPTFTDTRLHTSIQASVVSCCTQRSQCCAMIGSVLGEYLDVTAHQKKHATVKTISMDRYLSGASKSTGCNTLCRLVICLANRIAVSFASVPPEGKMNVLMSPGVMSLNSYTYRNS